MGGPTHIVSSFLRLTIFVQAIYTHTVECQAQGMDLSHNRTGFQPLLPHATEESHFGSTEFGAALSMPDQPYTDQNQSSRATLESLTFHACGSKVYCERQNISKRRLCDFECQKCRCDSQCSLYGDCCVDISNNFVSTPSASVSQNASCFTTGELRLGRNTKFAMIGTCPKTDSYDEKLIENCQDPDPTDQAQVTPVSNLASKLTYRNSYCARCNGIEEYLSWTFDISCPENTAVSSARSDEDLWRIVNTAGCNILAVAPERIPAIRCRPASIGVCNVTGNWTEKDDIDLETLCATFQYPVSHNGLLYKNIFCAMCNGINLSYSNDSKCHEGALGPDFPLPITILLDLRSKKTESSISEQSCLLGEMVDPFSGTCMALHCRHSRMLQDGRCVPMYTSSKGLGFSIEMLLNITGGEFNQPYSALGENYFQKVLQITTKNRGTLIESFRLYIVSSVVISDKLVETLLASLRVIFTTDYIFEEAEAMLDKISSLEWTMTNVHGQNITLTSFKSSCPNLEKEPNEAKFEYLNTIRPYLTRFLHILPAYEVLECPFLEYNISDAPFSFDPLSDVIFFKGRYYKINGDELLLCGTSLKICSKALEKIGTFLDRSPLADPTLSMVSLICLIFSLLGLLLTFIVFLLLPQLRTLPGKITMLLAVHLFSAQLLFLVGSNWAADAVACKVFGVLIHYSWMSTFSWTMVSAYHMYKGFTAHIIATKTRDGKKIGIYFVVCHLFPVVLIGSCLMYHAIRFQEAANGYGGTFCFLNEPVSLGVFFAVPLFMMLLFNLGCFALTIKAIRSVPDMEKVSNHGNRQYVFVYIKLSLILGFSWTFGILGSLFRSSVIQYTFVVLTGSQGVFFFVTYCMTSRTLHMLKKMLIGEGMSKRLKFFNTHTGSSLVSIKYES